MQLRAGAQLSDDVLTITFDGEITMSTLPALNDLLLRNLKEHPGVAFSLNFDAIHSVDDAGLGVLLGFAGKLRAAHTPCIVVCSQPRIRERLAATGFDTVVPVI